MTIYVFEVAGCEIASMVEGWISEKAKVGKRSKEMHIKRGKNILVTLVHYIYPL
jgi:sugar phosphate permease